MGSQCAESPYVAISGVPLGLDSRSEGVLKFSRASLGTGFARVTLALNVAEYGTGEAEVLVSAYGSAKANVVGSEAYQGNGYLGVLLFPSEAIGQEFYLDVTSFVQQSTGAYLAFQLSAGQGLVVSGLSFNAGHASQLVVTPSAAIPEPGEAYLLAAGLLTLAAWLRRRADKTAPA